MFQDLVTGFDWSENMNLLIIAPFNSLIGKNTKKSNFYLSAKKNTSIADIDDSMPVESVILSKLSSI